MLCSGHDERHQHLGWRQRSMHADQGELAWECPRHDRPISTKRDQHMSPAVSELIIRGGEPAFVDRLVSSPYPSQLCKPRPPSVRYSIGRLMINIELTETALAETPATRAGSSSATIR